jgi:hypothetical protein
MGILGILFPGIKTLRVFAHTLGRPQESCGKIADPNNKLLFQV